MSDQKSIGRARFLKTGAAAGLLLGTSAVSGCGSQDDGNAAKPVQEAARTALLFFTQTEANTVTAMAERVFPADANGPGATDTHVLQFLDRRLDGAYGLGATMYMQGPFIKPQTSGHGWQIPATPREVYRDAVAAINVYANAKHGSQFYDIPIQQQDAVLSAAEKGSIDSFHILKSDDFMKMFITHVTQGLFADPLYAGNYGVVGWEFIGFPGDPMAYGDQYEKLIDQYKMPYNVTPVALQ